MIDFPAIEKAFFDWATLISGLKVIWVNENGPQPDKSYITLNSTSLVQTGHDFQGNPDVITGEAKIQGNREFTLTIEAFGDNSEGILESLVSSLERDSVRQPLRVAGISYVDRFSMINITGLEDTLFISRHSLDTRWRIFFTDTTVPAGVIENAEIDSTYLDVDGSTILTDKIIINT